MIVDALIWKNLGPGIIGAVGKLQREDVALVLALCRYKSNNGTGYADEALIITSTTFGWIPLEDVEQA